MKVLTLLLSVSAAVTAPATVRACDLCTIYSAREAQGLTGRGLFAGVAEQYTAFGTLQEEGHEVPGGSTYLDSSISQLLVGYNLNKRFGVQVNLPVIYRSYGSDTMHATESGIGDLSVLGNFVACQKLSGSLNATWTVLGGVRFPTGNPAALGRPDEFFPEGLGGHDVALGSGSYDGLLGSGVVAGWRHWFFNASVQYAIRSEGAFHHQYANDLSWLGGPGYYLAFNDDYTLGLQIAVSGETKGKDTFSGVPDPDSAETLVYVGPQLDFTWGSSFSAELAADLPAYRGNSGLQVLPDFRLRAAVTMRF